VLILGGGTTNVEIEGFAYICISRNTHTVEIDSFVPPASSRRDQRKSPAKRRAGPAFGYAGDGLPSRCIRRYRLPSRCTRKKFHARPEQGNGPAADGASFSLTLKFIGVRKEPLFPSGTKTIRGLGNRSARFHHPHPSTVCVPRAFPGSHLCCGRPDCVAGHVGLELRNVGANYPFERAQDLRGSSRILAAETIRV
jgi:hypothetical protein